MRTGSLQRDVGGAIGGVLVAGAPLGLRQIHRRRWQLQNPTTGLHARDRYAQRRQCAVVITLDERSQPSPRLGQLENKCAVAGEIAVDLIQKRRRARGVAVGAQRQLCRENLMQRRQDGRPVDLDELAAPGERGAGLINSAGVQQYVGCDDGVRDAAERTPTRGCFVLLQRLRGAPGGTQRTDPARPHRSPRPRRCGIVAELVHPAAEIVDAEQHAVEQTARGLGSGWPAIRIQQGEGVAHDIHIGAAGRSAEYGMHVIDAPGQHVAPCHQRGSPLGCHRELVPPAAGGQFVGDAGTKTLVVARHRQHESGLGEPDLGDRHNWR
ncbi:hypothetical protein MAUB1S_00052 [Mycolicibacterium aubagnense]